MAGDRDPVWYRDVRVLARRPAEFFPAADQTPEERVNSIVRLLLYCTAAVFVYSRQGRYAAFGLASVAVVSLAYRASLPERPGRQGRPGRATRPASVAGIPVDDVLPAQRECTPSTADNPFGNVLIGDDPGRAPACPYDEQASVIRDNFNKGLVRNVYDVYEKENSQRQWMTNPVTTSTPDTIAFANFCYGNAGRRTCKEDPSKCTGSFP